MRPCRCSTASVKCYDKLTSFNHQGNRKSRKSEMRSLRECLLSASYVLRSNLMCAKTREIERATEERTSKVMFVFPPRIHYSSHCTLDWSAEPAALLCNYLSSLHCVFTG